MAQLHKYLNLAMKIKADGASEAFKCDVLLYKGDIDHNNIINFRLSLEELKENSSSSELAIILSTPGGSVECAEQMVKILRHHYKMVSFIVDQSAMSAGTVLCMSGDNLYMNYASALGPIDPQVYTNGGHVPALGYIDLMETYIEKSAKGKLTDVEFAHFHTFEVGHMQRFREAAELSEVLTKEWLIKYNLKGKKKAAEIAAKAAKLLSNNKHWHSHGRMIGIEKVKKELGINVVDYTHDETKLRAVREYVELAEEYVVKEGLNLFIHTFCYADGE